MHPPSGPFACHPVMSYEGVPVSRVCEEIDAAVPDALFEELKTIATVEGILRLASDPEARGDVATQLTRPSGRTPSTNEWAHLQADTMMLRMM